MPPCVCFLQKLSCGLPCIESHCVPKTHLSVRPSVCFFSYLLSLFSQFVTSNELATRRHLVSSYNVAYRPSLLVKKLKKRCEMFTVWCFAEEIFVFRIAHLKAFYFYYNCTFVSTVHIFLFLTTKIVVRIFSGAVLTGKRGLSSPNQRSGPQCPLPNEIFVECNLTSAMKI